MVVKYLLRIESFPSTYLSAYINFTSVREKCDVYKP
jgi:hypothetical protein